MTEYIPKPSHEEIENLTLDELKLPTPLKLYLKFHPSEAEEFLRGYKAGIKHNAIRANTHNRLFYVGYYFGPFHNRPYEELGNSND